MKIDEQGSAPTPFLKVLKRQREQALKHLKKQPVDMRQRIEAVGTAANEKKVATMIGLVQRAIVRLAQGTSPEGLPVKPTPRLAGGHARHACG